MKDISSFKLVIFDFDGVILSNSGEIISNFLSEKFLENGLNYTSEECYNKFLGLRADSILDIVLKEKNKKISTELIPEWRKSVFDLLIENGKINNSIKNFLNIIPNKCICSNSSFKLINCFLLKNNLKQYFPDKSIYSTDLVDYPKPSPDIFFLALKDTKMKRDDCCAIEDSVVGVKAAKSAKIFTFGYINEPYYSTLEEQAQKLLQAGADSVLTGV